MTDQTDIATAHLDLGELIEILEAEDPTMVIPLGFDSPHSYRGYYHELAFEPARNIRIGAMLEAARSALGATYTGYKGGDYLMTEHTGCWLAHYGDTGETIGRTLLRALLAAGRPALPAVDVPEYEYAVLYEDDTRSMTPGVPRVRVLRREHAEKIAASDAAHGIRSVVQRRQLGDWETAPAETSAEGCHRCNGSGVLPEHDGEDVPCGCSRAETSAEGERRA